jgi:hypothetical protein
MEETPTMTRIRHVLGPATAETLHRLHRATRHTPRDPSHHPYPTTETIAARIDYDDQERPIARIVKPTQYGPTDTDETITQPRLTGRRPPPETLGILTAANADRPTYVPAIPCYLIRGYIDSTGPWLVAPQILAHPSADRIPHLETDQDSGTDRVALWNPLGLPLTDGHLGIAIYWTQASNVLDPTPRHWALIAASC